MSKFDLLFSQEFTTTDTIPITHNLNRRVFNVRLITTDQLGGSLESESQRQLIEDILLDSTDPLNIMTVTLTEARTGIVQLIAEDTIQSPYYTVEEKLASQEQTELAGTFPVKFEYTGNANTNRRLEYVSGESSEDSPFLIVGDGKLRAVTFGASSLATGSIGIYANRLGSPVLLYTASYTAQDRATYKPLDIEVLEDDEVYVKVDSGAVTKPYIVTYFQII